jgi:hypothetical protein
MTRWCAALPAVLACLTGFGVGPAPAWCVGRYVTFRQEAAEARVILYGTLENPRRDGETGTTDLFVEAVLKTDDSFKVGDVVEIPRYIPPDPDDKSSRHFLVFCDLLNGQLDPYRGVPFQGKAGIDYGKGALALGPKDRTAIFRYSFRHLEHAEKALANDAYQEFANAPYADYREMARTLPADRIAGWLRDRKTPDYRYGLYATLLGHCGRHEHAQLLRGLLDSSRRGDRPGDDGILIGLVLLEPKQGFDDLAGILKDASEDFRLRYAALRVVRFFWDARPDLVEKKELLRAASALLDQGDIADLLIEDLRKWQQWQTADRVLALRYKASHGAPIMRRAMLRFALECPGQEAAAFVEEQRKKDAQTVQDSEELLKLESAGPEK